MSKNNIERCGIKAINNVVDAVHFVQDKMRLTPAFDDLISSKFHSSTNNGTSLAPLDGRSLLKSWLSPRVLTCEDPGYGLCPKTKTAVEVASASSLERIVVKVSHAKLDEIAALILIATQMEVNAVRMEAIALLEISVVTISTPSATNAPTVIPSSITKVPETSITLTPIPVYEYYYYTITWYYWSYYYYYYTIHLDLSTSTRSTQITTTTTISVYETNSAAASSSFQQLSATLSFPTPAAATLPTQTPPSSPTQTEQTNDAHTEVSIDTEFLKGTGSAFYSVFGTPSTTSSVTTGSSSSSTATSTPAGVTVSGASGMKMNGHFWSITGFTVFGACIVALWLL
ncbi:uncharacterized protein Bfra_006594 [Botrytis fragariae]|uniref:Uncharacterized protein n=1 Tax=Botrytis fragariae TaxID=1964551 RepID=A0A8H6B525_9HELO|nr:uncharacterized protein Bfra_006594 [Botrytis fragariae]KAF5879385.1 hypothetical protein Bfra_006594 [Botrytis fragariae]